MTTPPASPSAKVFSPVKLAESPCQTQRGNLTGAPRKVKDNVAEIFNTVQKWNKLHADGVAVLRKISQDILPDEETKEQSKTTMEALRKNCELAKDVKDKMAVLVDGLATVHGQFESLEKLDKLNRTSGEPIFLTWPMSLFVALSKRVYSAYCNQLALNVHIVESVAFSTKKSARGMVEIWLYQPCVDPIVNFELECALKETGFT
ncbi:Hypothetical protein NTJ_07292 [Nesidiocoris tenuis]|uniref:Uncharacterized protein n=1 Tax=Nesidiocoris tenuis TaxID=355587 RepID=A0ABN7AT74_9HEMI|nr:Hypothetical protein NTJ_07292 [Nesidiocoris tenuis]